MAATALSRPAGRPAGGPVDRSQRFLGFAFACADLLFEVSPDDRIGFALGATGGLTEQAADRLVGRDWLSLFQPAEVPLLRSLVRSLTEGSRCGPVEVGMALQLDAGRPARASFSSCRLPGNNGAVSCVLSRLQPGQPAGGPAARPDGALLDKDGFADLASQIVRSGSGLEDKLKLSVVDVPGLERLQGLLASVDQGSLIERIGALIKARAVGGNAAGQLSPSRFGLLHDADQEIGTLTAEIADATRQADPTGVGCAVKSEAVDVDPTGLSPDEAMRAVHYVVNHFATAQLDGSGPGSLVDAFETLVAETVTRMQQFMATIKAKDFELAFQPIVGLKDGKIHHHEVLIRFEQDRSPFEKIRFAEEIGLIEALDLAVCSRVAKLMGGAVRQRLAVNVSGRSLQNGLFVRSLVKLLDESPGLAGRLMFEITESAELKDLKSANDIIQDLRRRGFAVCLDDFGAGAASFQYLQALNVDFVKIDGAYVKRIGHSGRDEALLRGLVDLCRSLEVSTIAEMVETEQQAAMLAAIGVGYCQGWLFGKPQKSPVAQH